LQDIDAFKARNLSALEDVRKEAEEKIQTIAEVESKWNVASGYEDLIKAY